VNAVYHADAAKPRLSHSEAQELRYGQEEVEEEEEEGEGDEEEEK